MQTINILYTGDCPIVIPEKNMELTVAEQLAAAEMAKASGTNTETFEIPMALVEPFLQIFYRMERAQGNDPRMELKTTRAWWRGPNDGIVIQECYNNAMPPMLFIPGHQSVMTYALGTVLMQRSGLFTQSPEHMPFASMDVYKAWNQDRCDRVDAVLNKGKELDIKIKSQPDVPVFRMDGEGIITDAKGTRVSKQAAKPADPKPPLPTS